MTSTKITKSTTPQKSPPTSEDEFIKSALMQKALGFQTSEVVEEYSCENPDGTLKLNKKKVLTKQYPPDLDAVQKLIDLNGLSQFNVQELADFELEKEKQRLLALLEKGDNNENNT